jgi:hypothetical protein
VKQTRFELHSRCNDRWLNSYVHPIMEVWRANMDMRSTVDVGKIIDYMTKYVTKAETASSSTARHAIGNVMKSSLTSGRSVQSTLRTAMCKLLRTRSMSREECCHLIMSLPLVHSSHKTFNINLEPGAQFNKLIDEDIIVQNTDEGGHLVTMKMKKKETDQKAKWGRRGRGDERKRKRRSHSPKSRPTEMFDHH